MNKERVKAQEKSRGWHRHPDDPKPKRWKTRLEKIREQFS